MKLLKLLLFLSFFIGSLGMNAQIEKTITPSGAIKFKGIIMHKGDAAPKALMVADVPKEQITKDCQFFGGDTLNGFDFTAAEKGAQMQNAKMYMEYKAYIHQQQAAFVKQKYNIQTLPGELVNRNGGPHTLSSACSNMDFENGNFSSWTITYGINQNSNGALTVAGTTPVYDINQDIYDCWPANQITSAYGNDPVSALPGLDPAGGSYSARLGGYFFNEAVGYDGGYCGNQLSNTYADGEIFSQSFVVTAANALISFDYQIVLNDGTHANGSQPYFHAQVTNAGGAVLSTCTDYSVQVNGGGGVPPGFIDHGWVNGNDNSAIYNGPWVSNSINLTPYIGQTIILKFSAAGCTLGGHWAYAYIDATCGPANLIISNPTPCAGGTSVLTAPAIYNGSYSWSGPGIVGSTTGQSVTVNATGTYNCTITPIQGAGCAYTLSQSITFTAPPTVSFGTGSQAACSGAAVAAEGFTSSPAGGTFTWTNSNTNIGIAASGSGNIAGYTAPVVASQQIGTISVTPTVAGCVGTSNTFNITINPNPTVSSNPGAQAVCSGAAVAGEGFTSTPAGGTFAWTNSNTNIGLAASGSGNISGYTAPVVATQQVGTISVTSTLNGCSGAAGTFNITINPPPTVSFGAGSQSACSGAAVAGEGFTSTPAGGTFAWTNSNTNIGIVASGSGNIAGYTAPVVASQQIGTISVTPTVAGCVGTLNTFNITINPNPTVSSNPGAQVVCSGAAVAGEGFTSTPAGGTFAWTNSNTNIGLAASGSGNILGYTAPVVATQQIGTISVTSTLNGCSGAAGTFNITINPPPTVSFGTGSQSACSGAAVTGEGFTSTPAGGTFTWTNSNTNIGVVASGSGNISGYTAPVVASQQIGTITVTPTVAGCVGTSNTFNITINPLPGETGGTISPAGCGMNNGTIIGAAGTGGSGNYSYQWNNTGGFVAGSSYTNGAGTYPLQIKDNVTGCIYSQNFTIPNAGAPPAPTVTASATSACVGGTVTFTVPTVAGVTYNWTESNGNIGTGASYTVTNMPASPNPYIVGVTATSSGCTGASYTTGITVNPLPTAAISNSTSQICQGSSTTLSVTPIGAYSYQWGNSSGTIAGATTNTLVVTTPDTYSVTVTDNTTNCSASTAANGAITVNPLPTIDTTGVIITQTSCTITTGGITNVTLGGASTITYTWTSGNTVGGGEVSNGSGNNATLSNVSAGPYCLSITDGNGCQASFCSITVTAAGAPAQPVLTAAGNDTTYCLGDPMQTLTVTVASSGTVTPTINWYSDANLTTAIATNTNTYTPSGGSVGTNTIYVATNVNGCNSAGRPIIITINPTPPAPILTAPTGTNNSFCQGSPVPLTVNSGTSTAVWYSNNAVVNIGSTFNPPANTPAGTYTFSVIDSIAVAGGCINAQQSANTVTLTLVVNPTPPAPILTAPTGTNNSFCQGSPVPLTVNSGTAPSTAVWYSNNAVVNIGSTFNPPANTPAGTYTFSVIDSIAVAGGCVNAQQSANTVTLTLVVNPIPPTPILTAPTGTNNSFCQGSPVPLTVNSGTAPSTAVWYSNNAVVNLGSIFNPPANTPAGTYTFSVIDSIAVAGGCVNAQQSANTVTLTLVVNPTPPAPILTAPTGTNNSFCQGSPVPLTVNSGTSTAVWYSNNAVVNLGSTFNPPANTPAGTYTFSVIDSIAVAGGCVNAQQSANTVTLTLVVNPIPPTPILTAPTGTNNSFCQGSPVPLTVNSGTAPSTAVWYSNNAVVNLGSTFNPPANTPAGTYTFSVIDSMAVAGGCINAQQSANTVTLTLVVNPTPTIDVSGAGLDSAKCGQATGGVSNLGVNNVNGGTPGYHFQWLSGGQPIAGATSPVLSGQQAGNYSLLVTDTNGCVANAIGGSLTFSVPATTAVIAQAITNPSPATGTIPLAVSFTNTSTGGGSYVWSFGDGNGSILTNPTNTYTNAGTYTVTLTATNGACSNTYTIAVIANIPTAITIPNIFSPNGDGINDEFFIINTGMVSLNCDIFNRWGQLLHTITAPNQGWDGIVPNGDKAPEGTYMYLLQAQGLDGKTYKQQGTVTLVR